jgi:type 1 fimbriae regulatory protein FimB/type 1 fimbriae regulatory protein FimE
LLESEVESMMRVAKTGRWGHRDALLILMGYRHGLRISELVNLRSGSRWILKAGIFTFVG